MNVLFSWEILMWCLFRLHSGTKAPQLSGNSLEAISNRETKFQGKFTKNLNILYCYVQNLFVTWLHAGYRETIQWRRTSCHISTPYTRSLHSYFCRTSSLTFFFWIPVKINVFTNSIHKLFIKAVVPNLFWCIPPFAYFRTFHSSLMTQNFFYSSPFTRVCRNIWFSNIFFLTCFLPVTV